MTNQNEAKNCPKRDNNVESETELIITEVNELNKVKRPVGRPRKHFDPNHKYERKNKYFFCDVCNKTCEYYHQKKHFKTISNRVLVFCHFFILFLVNASVFLMLLSLK